MLGDKLGMHRICEENGIPTIPILIFAENGKLDIGGNDGPTWSRICSSSLGGPRAREDRRHSLLDGKFMTGKWRDLGPAQVSRSSLRDGQARVRPVQP